MGHNKKIPGGYALQPRVLFEHETWETWPLLRRCLWQYLWGMANYKDRGKIKRGQLLTSHAKLQDVLSYKVGYRTIRPSKSAVENCTKAFTKAGMIAVARTTRGMIITICNYDLYQNKKNYESRSESRSENYTKGATKGGTIHKKEERKKRERTSPVSPLSLFSGKLSKEFIESFTVRFGILPKQAVSAQALILALEKMPEEFLVKGLERYSGDSMYGFVKSIKKIWTYLNTMPDGWQNHPKWIKWTTAEVLKDAV